MSREAETVAPRARAARVRAAGVWLARVLRTHLEGLGLLDAVYFVTLFTFGSYFLIDTPANFLLFALYFWLVVSPRPGRRKFALFVMLTSVMLLAASGMLIWVAPRVTPPGVYLRIVHQTTARYALLIGMPYLIRHLRTPLAPHPTPYRWATRAGWLFFKVSIWVAAIPALLTIRGRLTSIHTATLGVALPLLAYHVFASVRRRRAAEEHPPPVEPFAVSEMLSGPLVCGALAVTCVPLAFACLFRVPSSWANYDVPDFMVRSSTANFRPSPAHTTRGAAFRPELLGESNGCGQAPCHPEAFADWRRSAHHESSNERYQAELERVVRSAGLPAARLCAGCHDPIALFSGSIEPGAPLVAPESIREGISCLVCHGLAPAARVPGNGSNAFRFPASYFVGPVSLPTLVGGWREHRADLHGPGVADDRVCVGCHRFLAVPRELADLDALGGWLTWPEHAQARMRSECRGEAGCVACHMPRIGEREKPWGGALPIHHFDLDAMAGGAHSRAQYRS
ncbi:MAG: multiheme c-type cytochrome [bacterium]